MSHAVILDQAPVAVLGDAVERAKDRVLIASPFIGSTMAEHLAELLIDRMDAAKGSLQLLGLTNLSRGALEGGFTSIDGLKALLEATVTFRSATNLHAKVFVVDESFALVGSNNLTGAGMAGGNAELGVILRAPRVVREVANVFDSWWRQTTDADQLDAKRLTSRTRNIRPTPRAAEPLIGHRLETPGTGEKFKRSLERSHRRSAIASLQGQLVRDGAKLPGIRMRVMPAHHDRDYHRLRRLRQPVRGDGAEADETREILLAVLARHRAADVRAHASWRLSSDVWVYTGHKAEIRRALQAQRTDDPAEVVRRNAATALRRLGNR